jgi:hypothetical protein
MIPLIESTSNICTIEYADYTEYTDKIE